MNRKETKAEAASGANLEEELREAEAALTRAAAALDLGTVLSNFADDAVVLPPGLPALEDRDAIRTFMADALAATEYSVDTETIRAEAAASAELGYTFSTYNVSGTPPGGKRVAESGRVVRLWKKQSGGAWKITLEIWHPAPAGVK